MSYRIPALGVVEFTIPASAKLALNSKSPAQVFQYAGYPNQPQSMTLLKSYAGDEDYVSSAFSAATLIRIEAGAADVLYNYGAAAVIPERRSFLGQPAPNALDTTGTLTAAMVLGGIVTSSTAAAVTGTIDTASIMDAAVQMALGEAIEFSVINTGGANSFTVAVATGITAVGSLVVANSTSGRFRLRKTAAATYILYRVA